jgi:hypothetical protein
MTKSDPSAAFHALTIGAMIDSLAAIEGVLNKAEAYAAKLKVDPKVLLEARLYPDMFNLIQQLQYVLYLPVEFARHFTDREPPNAGSEEATFADVYKSLKAVRDFLASVEPAAMTKDVGRVVPAFFNPSRGMEALSYAAHMMVPDFYFHLTTAYAILRHNGVQLAKSDFTGPLKTTKLG